MAETGHATRAALLDHPLVLWTAFFAVHILLGVICLTSPSLPMGDVTITYLPWIRAGLDAGIWVGLNAAGVYPVLALLPMLASAMFGWTFYASMWLTLATLIDAIVFAVLLHRRGSGRRTAPAAWWWLAFMLALGPVVLGRIDVFATAAALVGVVVIAARPALGAALLMVGAWVKVWPAALVAAAFLAFRSRVAVALGASLTTLGVLLAGIVAGGGAQLFSFITQQTGRGLQIESPLATALMWSAWAGGAHQLYYDRGILTYQLSGDGVDAVAALSTPLLAVAVGLILALGVVSAVRGASAAPLFAWLSLALTVALILFNKVGSPQFVGWLAVPVILGLITTHSRGVRGFRGVAALALLIGVLTHAFYPHGYGALLSLDTVMLAALTARNILYAVLFVWAMVALCSTVLRRGQAQNELATES